MDVLKLNKQLLAIMGLRQSEHKIVNFGNQLWNGALILIQLSVYFPIFAHLLAILGDISGTTDALYTVCTFSMALEMYILFVARKSDLNRLLTELGHIVSKRNEKKKTFS